MKILFLTFLFISTSFASEFLELNYSLPPGRAKIAEECNDEVAGPVLKSNLNELERVFEKANEDTIVIRPSNMEVLGMKAEDALKASRDGFKTAGCSSGHDQGDLANRWCHSAIARTFTSVLEAHGVDATVAALAGAVFWAPKEFFYDLHPSAGDFVFTYRDRLGTKRTTFEVTVYGDSLFEHRPFEKVSPFRESTPFITIRRKLGPQ